ncbi:uncharacterized protein [Enoplosus armatus]|uniref:uncharacterized protein n=1 Tax=Enoplosus armatus TaxID=215367 RepID=UPI0039928D3F
MAFFLLDPQKMFFQGPAVKTDAKEISHEPRSPSLSPCPRIGNEDGSTEHTNQPAKQLVNPVCSLVFDSLSETSASPTPCGNSPSSTHAHQRLPDISSHKGSAAVAAAANSVLKTLFLCLSPYQQDGEQRDSVQISVPSESEQEDKSSAGCVFVKQQQKSEKKGRRKKKLKTEESEERAGALLSVQLFSQTPQTPHISSEAIGGSTLSSPGMTDSQVRNSGTHDLPFTPVAPPMQHHTRPRLTHTSEEGKWVNGNVAATPLKDLFKTLDTTVFHFGH